MNNVPKVGGWLIGIFCALAFIGTCRSIGVPGVLNEGLLIPTLGIALGVRVGRSVFFLNARGSLSRRSQQAFRRAIGAMAVLAFADALISLVVSNAVENETARWVVEGGVAWGLGAWLFVKWDPLLSRESRFDMHDAMVLHSAISAGENGFRMDRVYELGETVFAAEMGGPDTPSYREGVTIGQICQSGTPLFVAEFNDRSEKEGAIKSSIEKLLRARYLRLKPGVEQPKSRAFRIFQVAPNAFSACTTLTWGKPLLVAISELCSHLDGEGDID